MPACILKPQNSADVQALVKWVALNKAKNPGLAITGRSAGTDMGGGALGESIIADFTAHFSNIISIQTVPAKPLAINPDEQTCGEAVVEPGVFYRDFEKATLEKGLILPCYTASKSLNTVGGMAANNSAGEKSLSYGQTKDYVEELNVVLSDGNEYVFGELDNNELEQKLKIPGFEGEIYRKMFRLLKDNYDAIKKAKPSTSKNSAGYLLWEVWDKVHFNLAKLIVGSQGTLGLITKIKFKLVKPKPKSELLVIFMKDLANLGDVVASVVSHKPESFESFDDHTFKLAMKFLPDMIKRMKGNLITLGLQFLPEVWMTITGGVPKLILIAEFTGETEEEIYQKILIAQKEIQAKFKLKTHITKSAAEAEKYWTVRRESFNLLRQHTHGLSTAPFVDDIIVHPDPQLPFNFTFTECDFCKISQFSLYTVAGPCRGRQLPYYSAHGFNAKADQRMIIPKLADEVYDLVLKYKGSITAEHNDGIIRSPYLEKMFGPEIAALFKQAKEIFDPQNIFNPGKKVGATLEYAMAHIKRTL